MNTRNEAEGFDQYRVLIVDDDEFFRKSQKRLMSMVRLSDLGAYFVLIEAGDKDSAIQAVKEHEIDCVILDYLMPGGNGLEYMQEMLKLKPDMAVIIVTGAGSEQIAVDAMKAGAMDYLVKGGISLESMERAIVNAVKRSRLLREIEIQRKQLIEAERYRVMAHSIGAACHHLGQPATVLRTAIVQMRRHENSPEVEALLKESFIAVEEICNILFKLKNISSYAEELYLNDSANDRIMKV